MYLNHKKGFTLLELIVTIAIISVLVATILTALAQAREVARCVICSSHLHQIVSAMNFYADSYDDWYPTAEPIRVGHLSYGIEWFKNVEFLRDISNKLLVCPTQMDPTMARQGIKHNFELSYVMNAAFGSWRWDKGEINKYRRRTEFEHPSQTFVFSDGIDYWGYFPGIVLYRCIIENFDFRHHHTANIAFLDSHIGTCRFEDIPFGVRNKYLPFWSVPGYN